MKLVRNTRDKASREFWQFVEKTAREVETWPDWMKGGTTKGEGAQAKRQAKPVGAKKKP
jgi:hypothetical protein